MRGSVVTGGGKKQRNKNRDKERETESEGRGRERERARKEGIGTRMKKERKGWFKRREDEGGFLISLLP